VAAVTFGTAGSAGDASIEDAYRMLGPLFGGTSAAIFMVSLLASGLSSSVVGTMAGQVIMQDFIDWRIPLWTRRLVTMLPTIIVAGLGYRYDKSARHQASRSEFCPAGPADHAGAVHGQPQGHGRSANSRADSALAIAGTAIVLLLNALLLVRLALAQ
jgi:manganese transport protein